MESNHQDVVIGKRYVVNRKNSQYDRAVGTATHVNGNLVWLRLDCPDEANQEVVFYTYGEHGDAIRPADLYDEIHNLSKNDLMRYIDILVSGYSPEEAFEQLCNSTETISLD